MIGWFRAPPGAERKTPGGIAPFFSVGKLKRVLSFSALRKFQRLDMHKTRERNAVLIFVAPRAHKFAVIGDKAIHEKCGDVFWQQVTENMRTHFQNEKFSHALEYVAAFLVDRFVANNGEL